jgi:hypothetical protein
MTRRRCPAILAAKTIAELMTAADTCYRWDLPTSFPPGTVLAQLWATPIKVSERDASYEAKALEIFPFGPVTALNGDVVIEITQPQSR